jgi:hypothetical protein
MLDASHFHRKDDFKFVICAIVKAIFFFFLNLLAIFN